jgi:hypothetical protein
MFEYITVMEDLHPLTIHYLYVFVICTRPTENPVALLRIVLVYASV